MKLSIKALAITAGLLWGGCVFFVALGNLVWPAYGVAFLQLCSAIYSGYHTSGTVGSVIIGTLYALLDGGVGGAVFAWLYNHLAG